MRATIGLFFVLLALTLAAAHKRAEVSSTIRITYIAFWMYVF